MKYLDLLRFFYQCTDFELTDILIQVGLTICIINPYIWNVLLILITSYRVDFKKP